MSERMAGVLVAVLLAARSFAGAGSDADMAAAGIPLKQRPCVVGTLQMGVGDERDLNAHMYGTHDADSGKRVEGEFVRNEPVQWGIFAPVSQVRQSGDSLTIKATKKGTGYVLGTRKCYFKTGKPWKESLIPGGAKEGEEASRLIEIWVIKVTKGGVMEEEPDEAGDKVKGGVTSDIPRAVIRGRTVMVGTHEPVEGAAISFSGPKAGVIQDEGWVSGSSGNFSIRVFERFVTGDYEVMARKASRQTAGKGADGRPDPFTVMNDLWPVRTYIFNITPAKAARGPIDVGDIEMNFVSNIWDGTKGGGRDTPVKVGQTPPPPGKGPGKGPGAPPPVTGGGSAGGGAGAPPSTGGDTSGAGGFGGGSSSGDSSSSGGEGGGEVGGGAGGGGGETAGPADTGKGSDEGATVGEPETPQDEGESEPGETAGTPTGGVGTPKEPGEGVEGPDEETETPEEPGEEAEPPPPEVTPPAPPPPADTGKGKPDIQIIEKDHPRPPPAQTQPPAWTPLPPSVPATPDVAPPAPAAPETTPPARKVSDLSKEELGDLLHCLCAASAGQSFGTYVAYNPKPSDASPSCEDPGNGPCIAGNWGCWRAFINFAAPGATQCLASFGLRANDCDTLRALDEYNRKVEKPLRVKVVADRTEIRVGESTVVRAEISGGRPPYNCYWFAHGQNPYSSWDYENIAMGPSVRVWTNIPGQGAQQIMYVANTYEFKGGAPGKFEIRARVISSFYSGSDQPYDFSRCLGQSSPDYSELYHAPISPVSDVEIITVLPEEKPEEPPEEEKAPVAPPSKPVHGGGSGYSPPAAVTPPSAGAPPESEPSVSVPSGSASVPVTSDRPSGTPKPFDDAGAPASSPSAPPPGEKESKAPPAVTPAPPPPAEKPKEGPTPPAGTEGDCSFGGGGSVLDNGPMNIFAEVPPGQRIRLTITGSDGFSQTVEGVGRVEISRPRSPSGTDTITMENLDVPGCMEQQVAQYDTNGIPAGGPPPSAPGLAGSEPGLGEYPAGAAAGGAGGSLGGFVEGTGERISADTATEFEKNQVFTDGQIGEAKSQADIREADAARDQAGWAAQGTKKASAADTAAEDAKSGWGRVISDAVFGGVQEGAEAAASAFGGKAADHVSEEIFDDHEEEEPAEEAGPVEGSGGAQVAGGPSDSGTSGDHDKDKGGGKKGSGKGTSKGSSKGGATKPGHVATDSVTCPSCGKLVTYPSGQQPKWCPYCCAGPGSVECAHCGYRWCGRKGPSPDKCPSCGWGKAPDEPADGVPANVPADVPAPAVAPAGTSVSP